MGTEINIYCDESCHLENDGQKAMVIGAVWCPAEKTKEISGRLREIKKAHGFDATFEMKWGKVSPSKAEFYMNILDYFFDDDDLHFRAIVIPDKSLVDHRRFKQDHDSWYYKMYFGMLKILLEPTGKYRIYLDVKDTCSSEKMAKLQKALCNNVYDFKREIIDRVETVSSRDVAQVQLTDLLVGIVGYANRGLCSNTAKVKLVERMRERSGYSLVKSTLLMESKVNLLLWEAQGKEP